MIRKTTTVNLDEDLVLQARILCLKSKKTFSEYVESLIKKDLDKKGE